MRPCGTWWRSEECAAQPMVLASACVCVCARALIIAPPVVPMVRTPLRHSGYRSTPTVGSVASLYFSDRLHSEGELPAEFKLFLPIQKAQ